MWMVKMSQLIKVNDHPLESPLELQVLNHRSFLYSVFDVGPSILFVLCIYIFVPLLGMEKALNCNSAGKQAILLEGISCSEYRSKA